jgi:hypothetical protein
MPTDKSTNDVEDALVGAFRTGLRLGTGAVGRWLSSQDDEDGWPIVEESTDSEVRNDLKDPLARGDSKLTSTSTSTTPAVEQPVPRVGLFGVAKVVKRPECVIPEESPPEVSQVLVHPANKLLRNRIDPQGNVALPIRAYVLLRAPAKEHGGSPVGIYLGDWDTFRQLLPGKAYPAKGVNLKGEDTIERAFAVWQDRYRQAPRSCPIIDLTGSGCIFPALQFGE